MNLGKFAAPIEVGQTVTLTKYYDDAEGFIKDGNGNLVCHVKGWLVHVGDVDRPASQHFGRECLTWRLCVASRIMNSQIGDIAVQPVKPDTVGELKKRFPGAFAEYEQRYGDENIPARRDNIAGAFGEIGEYEGDAETYEEYMDRVRGMAKPTPEGINARREELQRQLAALDTVNIAPAFEQPSEFAQPETGTNIAVWGGMPINARKTLMQHGVLTVEEFAKANDSMMAVFGPGQWNKWRDKAKEEAGD